MKVIKIGLEIYKRCNLEFRPAHLDILQGLKYHQLSASSGFNRWCSIIGVVVIDGMGQQTFWLVTAFLGRVRGYQAKNSG